MKSALSILLVVTMILSIFTIVPFIVSAEETEIANSGETSGTTGECTWKLDGTVLTISGNGNMEDYIYSAPPWNNCDITKAIISYGVTNVSYHAFYNCSNLTSVDIPDTVTSISNRAFHGCSNLVSVTIPKSVKDIGNNAFIECNSLSRLCVDADNDVFDSRDNCNAIIQTAANKLIIGCGKTTIPNSIKSIGSNSFVLCKSLISLTIPESVTSIGGYAFDGCSNLVSITIPDSVTNIGGDAFNGTMWYNNQPDGLVYAGKVAYKMKGKCPSKVIINNGTLGVAGRAFAGRINLESVTIPNSVKCIGPSAFYNCNNLTSVTIPESVTSIESDAFLLCENLTYVIIPKAVTSIGDSAFKGCNRLTIYGYNDTVAITYAKNNQIHFMLIFGECDNCSAILTESDYYTGQSATCTEDGLTDGYTCPSCGYQVEQTVIPAPGHKPIIEPAVSATCQHDGHTIGSYCENCGEVYVQSQIIPKLPHTPVIDQAVAADCTHTGLTEGSHCSVCGEVITAQETTSALGHNYEVVEGTPATYFHSGLTDGVRCSRCSEWLIEQTVIPRLSGVAILGDADGNGDIETVDATYIQRYIVQIPTPYTKAELMRGDVDDSGELELFDATCIQRYLCQLKTDYPIGEIVL